MRRLTRNRLDPERLVLRVRGPDRGAVATFLGTVRSPNRGRRVRRVEYSAYEPMAERILERIEAEVRKRYPGVRTAVRHRLGRLRVGEASVAIAVAGVHRAEALRACAGLIEALKARAPIWKREVYTDGSAWIEADHCAPRSSPRVRRGVPRRPRR